MLDLEVAGEDGGEGVAELVGGDVGDEAQAALVDADQGQAVAGDLAGEAEHGAVAADDDGQVALGAEFGVGQCGEGGDAGAVGGFLFEGNIQSLGGDKIGNLFQDGPDAPGLGFSDDGHVTEALGHSAELHHSEVAGPGVGRGAAGGFTRMKNMLDDRAKTLLKALVERYIADGQPVGSRTLSKASGLELSPATIRNVMADLEELGLIASPHTSAGRIPTARGYRLFVDTLLTAKPGMPREAGSFESQLLPDQPQRVIANAAQLLSSLSSFVGVVTSPRKTAVFHHIEFLRLGERRVLVIMVSPDGDVQNRLVFTAQDLSQSDLTEASNRLNAHYAGLSLDVVRDRLRLEVDQLRGEIAKLMSAAVDVGQQGLQEHEPMIISGERNLLTVQDFSHDMGSLRRMFDLFEQKTQLMRLLDVSSRAEGVRIYIGGESQVVPVEELSIVSAPYEVDGEVVGTLGVIGPTRMAYDRMIEIVDITSRMVSNALSQK